MPVPGDGRYEWKGFLRQDELPQSFNPPEGFISTANEMNLPPDFPLPAQDWFRMGGPLSRYPRQGGPRRNSRLDIADAMALQNDDFSVNGRRLIRPNPAPKL